MNLREVTIGRSASCDIFLDSRCKFASSIHGTIYYDGSQLMYKDMSTNGTLINNVNVHKRAIPINRGDVIMIAGQYPLSWNQIDAFFPAMINRSVTNTVIAHSKPANVQFMEEPNTSKFNWGAFFLPGLWGLFNGCWWLFLLQMLPVPIIINVIAGMNGNEWAWKNKQWNSVQDFENTQETWGKVGVVLFCFSVLFYIFYYFALYN